MEGLIARMVRRLYAKHTWILFKCMIYWHVETSVKAESGERGAGGLNPMKRERRRKIFLGIKDDYTSIYCK